MAGTILLMDNIKDTLDKWGSLLEEIGYIVVKASTLEEAENVLKNKWIHLAILDIRMMNEDDENDISGLLLAQKPEFTSIPKIVLTSYPSFEYARSVLAPDTEGQRPAVNFIAKAEGPRKLIEAIEQAFDNQVSINWDLEIQLSSHESALFLYLSNLMEPDLSKDILLQRADELEDLFRRLFYDCRKIRIGRLFWNNGYQFCLSVLARSAQGMIDSYILVCGEKQYSLQGRKIMDELTSQSIQGTKLINTSETTHFSANIYGLPGADIEKVQTLRDLLQIGKERPLKTVFTHLLGDVLKEWHQHGQIIREKSDLMSIYRQRAGYAKDEVSRNQLEQRVDTLIQSVRALGLIEIEREDKQITLQFSHQPARSFPDPLEIIYAPLPQYNTSVVCRISPGNLKTESILVDSEQKTWLTDFAKAGQTPQWWDFVCLEASIRFDSNQSPDLLAWQEFEECLVKPNQLDEHLEQNDVVPELRTNIALIEQIRQQASNETGSNPIPYYAGLLVWIVEAISHFDSSILSTQPETLRNAHLLLAASMLAERLGMITNNSIPIGGQLLMDDNEKVWLGERFITTFSGLRLKLFRCLYEQAGKPVTTREIVEKVYGEIYDPLDRDQNQRIRQEIRRLRDAIEPKPSRPRYILTVREKGYLLQASGEPDK